MINPDMKAMTYTRHRSLEPLIHSICWGLFFAFPLLFTQRDNGSIDWPDYFRHSVMSFALFLEFYFNYLWLIPQILFKDHTRRYVIANLLLTIALTLLLRYWSDVCMPPFRPGKMHFVVPPRLFFYLRDFLTLAFMTGLSITIRMSIRWREAETARREAVKSRTEAELKNLRNQLNPHFLLNTLNNIYALIAFDADKAQQAVQELSKLLRYVLYDNQQTYVPLSKEVDFIRNYIELMRIRVSASVRIDTRFDTKPDSQTPIAPLIFISLIENAFKHGISPTEPSFIRIDISETSTEIRCTISNSNHPKTDQDKSGSGIGLEQVARRLELAYPGAYRWNCRISEDGKEYISSIIINLSQQNHAL